MTAREKIDAAVVYLKSLKIRGTTAAPPLWRVLWALGVHIPPPHFLSLPGIWLVSSLPFTLTMLALLTFSAPEPNFRLIAGLSLAGGICFGLGLAAYYRWSATVLRLPAWKDFASDDVVDPDDSW